VNDNTRVVILCCQRDEERVERHLPFHLAHQCPITVLSPSDSEVLIPRAACPGGIPPGFSPGLDCRNAGKRAYIGQDSLDRLRWHLSICLEYPENFFLIHEADSICLNPTIPIELYEEAEKGYAWCNEAVEPRPHPTPHRKIAMHFPLFFTRAIIYRILTAPPVPTHPITPYGDWWLTAHCWSANIPTLSYGVSPRLQYTLVHPVKTEEQLRGRIDAYKKLVHAHES
jgi:hypothetical protein